MQQRYGAHGADKGDKASGWSDDMKKHTGNLWIRRAGTGMTGRNTLSVKIGGTSEAVRKWSKYLTKKKHWKYIIIIGNEQ